MTQLARTEKASAFWLFVESVSTSCPCIYTLSSVPDFQYAYGAAESFSGQLKVLYKLTVERSLDNCEVSNSQYNDYCEDIEFSNEGELEAIARELAAVLGHRHF